ncbi:MAG: hypothetical protein WHT84_06815 [Breznakiellaceae bacterium]|jgi:hypothetical protein
MKGVPMTIDHYLGIAPCFEITRYSGGPPKDTVPFTGYPRPHPFEKEKLIFVFDPLGENPTILEFKVTDISYVEELPAVALETGETLQLVKIWVKKGAHGIIHEPFEVQDEVQFLSHLHKVRERIKKGLP